jgi:protein-ribulosamine 3-kinase
MILGEFTSISTIHAVVPDLVPPPVGWGKCKSSAPDTYFFIEEYIDMDFSAPDPVRFTARVAEMERKGTSPNGMFGFPVVTCDGKITHNTEWESSWAVFYSKLLRNTLEVDAEINGRWPELDAAAEQVINGVIPRLLGVLQADGRTLKPSLIHGDLWGGNVGTSLETGDVVLFDAGSYYAHNEMELGIWRCEWGQYFKAEVYFRNYLRNFEPAEPADEFDDRNRLYRLKYDLVFAGCFPGSVTRQRRVSPSKGGHTIANLYRVLNDMYYLCEKYAPLESLGRYDPLKDHSVTGTLILEGRLSCKV